MNKKDEIRVGDFVDVLFERCAGIYNAEVIYIPCSDGDNWKLVGEAGQAINVQRYCYMEKIK